MSSEQILLGVPAYGYLQISSVDSLIQRRSTTLYNGNGGTTDGQIDFRSIVDQGALALDGSGVYEGSGGFEREWDECSNTVSMPCFSVPSTSLTTVSTLILASALAQIRRHWPGRDI